MGNKLNALVGALGIVAASGAFAASTDFEYRVDSFSINGVVVDNFSSLNRAKWFIQWGTVTAVDGYAVLKSPGKPVIRTALPDITFNMSNMVYVPQQNGSSDFSAQSVWSTAYLPQAPGGFMGQYFVDSVSGTTFSINLSNFDQAAANAIGSGALTGLSMSFSEVTSSGSTVHVQQVSIMSQPFTGDLVMRLLFDKATQTLSASYSLDGGTTFQSPFAGLTSSGKGNHVLAGDPITVSAVPVPASLGLFGSALAGLVGLRGRKARA